MEIELNKRNYILKDSNIFRTVFHNEFNNLKIIPEVGILEREIGLIKDIISDVLINSNLIYIGKSSYTSFFLINTNSVFKKQYVSELNEEIIINTKDINNIYNIDEIEEYKSTDIVYIEPCMNIEKYNITKCNIFCQENEYLNNIYKYKFYLSKTNKVLYIEETNYTKFYEEFKYYIKENILEYDNLINLCIMVKNAGDVFEKILKENLSIIDKWTILDTGSTDNTIEIINKVLGKKKGKLYQEPFINFKDSRNRCLELAGKKCKYNLMLDDTYIIRYNLREFLETIRGDQFADSYSILIKSLDMEYYSNRITKSERELKYIYKIHEVINPENNVNVVIPKKNSIIEDITNKYMEERTMNRKQYDLKLLFEEIEENPDDPRNYYYVAQTYNLINEHEKAAEYYYKRAFHKNEGFEQERNDALFEMIRIYNFKLNKNWDECEKYYNLLYEWDKERPEALYFLGINYLLKGNKYKAFEYLKRAHEIGYPIHRQYSLKPTLSYYYNPLNLAPLCYEYEDYVLGEKCTKLFLEHNNKSDENYKLMNDWNMIFNSMNLMHSKSENPIIESNPLICFVADGGFNKWSGSTFKNTGMGGSETCVIELAQNIAKLTDYKVFVFCHCEKEEYIEGVYYKHLNEYFYYISNYVFEHCIINRYSEYIPPAIKGYVNNIHIFLHDIDLTGSIIPTSSKIKNIYCLSEWHSEIFKNVFPEFKNIIKPFHYGIDLKNFQYDNTVKKPYSFIYSSFPNRGLIVILKMWNKIKEKYKEAELNIFCNMKNEWCWKYYKQEMEEIIQLLEQHKNNSVINHGWVNKKILGDFWKKSSVWFYPCKFKETFCLTALEAAISKTLVFSTNLAALENTIGDRGIIIPGDDKDVLTIEWQNKALESICYYIDNIEKDYYINKNYEWALTHSWEERTKDLLTQLNINIQPTLLEESEEPLFINDLGLIYGYKNYIISSDNELNGIYK